MRLELTSALKLRAQLALKRYRMGEISRQRYWQIMNSLFGLCQTCGKKAVKGEAKQYRDRIPNLCTKHRLARNRRVNARY